MRHLLSLPAFDAVNSSLGSGPIKYLADQLMG